MANEDWMAGFTNRNDLTLCDITFPASHDAGLSEGIGCYVPYGKASSRANVICQHYNIAGQLDAGSRAFDLRIEVAAGVTRTFHGEGVFGSIGGGWGQDALSIFQQVDTFLTNHAGEIVILRISHTKESAGVHNLITQNINAARLFSCGPRSLAGVPLSQLRGKAIAIFDSKALATVDPYRGLHRLLGKYEKDKAKTQSGLLICGEYAGQSAGLLSMVKEAITCGNAHGGDHERGTTGKHNHLFMVYWQLAMDVKNKSTKGANQRLASQMKIVEEKGTHYNLDYLLNLHRGIPVLPVKGVATNVTGQNRMRYRPNYINLDFVDVPVCNKVIEFNNHLLP